MRHAELSAALLLNSAELKAMPEKLPIVLTIAGFDPSSGAGVTADIKTIAAHGCYGVACITALTVQSTSGVKRVQVVDPSILSESLEELTDDLDIAAVHIGMLGSEKIVKAVADFLSGQPLSHDQSRSSREPGRARLPNIVLDPILRSSSGAELLDAPGTQVAGRKAGSPRRRRNPKYRRSCGDHRNADKGFG